MTLREEFDSLVSEHIDGKPSVHSTQRLDQILSKHPKLRREYSSQVLMHQLLLECCKPPDPGQASRIRAIAMSFPERTAWEKFVYWLRKVFRRPACPACEKLRF